METAQRTADFCDISRSLSATTAALKKAQKAAMMSSPKYISAWEEIMVAGGVGTLGTRTTFGVSITITLLPWAVRRAAPHRATNTAWSGAIRPLWDGRFSATLRERKAGPIARVDIVSIIPCPLNEHVVLPPSESMCSDGERAGVWVLPPAR